MWAGHEGTKKEKHNQKAKRDVVLGMQTVVWPVPVVYEFNAGKRMDGTQDSFKRREKPNGQALIFCIGVSAV